MRMIISVACVVAAALGTPAAAADPELVAAAQREGKVVVYSVLSNAAAAPLVQGFRALYPNIEVAYDGEKGSTEMADAYAQEVAQDKPSADVVWSSAMDLQMRFVEQGYAQPYRSPEAAGLPAWASYRDLAYGTTAEPVALVYNKQLLKAGEVPADHASLARALLEQTERFRGKVTSFDPEKSGVGYMFAVADARHYPELPRLLQGLARADMKPSAGTGAMLTKINSGEYLLGYNIMGAYALGRARTDLPNLGVVFPKDYTLVLSRVMFISRQAAHPNAAKLWVDYLLSREGQEVLGDKVGLFAIRSDARTERTAAALMKELGASARPLALDFSLTPFLAPQRQSQFLQERRALLTAP